MNLLCSNFLMKKYDIKTPTQPTHPLRPYNKGIADIIIRAVIILEARRRMTSICVHPVLPHSPHPFLMSTAH